jgi:outer membrane protein assembly factor BamB
MKRNRFVVALMFVISAPISAGDWPAWRGPTGQGYCEEKNLPLKWSATENVKWKIKLAHQGNSTPIVWRDSIFLTQANKGGSVRSLLCFARAAGALRWQQDVNYSEKEKNWNESWYANASPVTDGERVVVSFGSAGMYCYDFAGKELWKRTDLGKWEDEFGNGSSPVIHGDLAILWCGPNRKGGRNFLLAVNKRTGETVWEHDESFGSWSTPLIVNVASRDQLILGQSRDMKSAPETQYGYLKGFDPKDGKELWKCQGLSSFVYTSALYSDGVAVGMAGFNGSAMAVKLGGNGDITRDRLWLHKVNTQRVGSGVIVGGHVYMVNENATPHCYDLKTGEDLWKGKPRLQGGLTWGSMVRADGRIYLLMRSGETVVLAANLKYEVLAVNPLAPGEQTNSSPAISDSQIFLRTFKHLWCIEAKK